MSIESDVLYHSLILLKANPGIEFTHTDIGCALKQNHMFYNGCLTPANKKDDSNAPGYEVWERSVREVYCHTDPNVERQMLDRGIKHNVEAGTWYFTKTYLELSKEIISAAKDAIAQSEEIIRKSTIQVKAITQHQEKRK